MPPRTRSASPPLSNATELISPQNAVQAPCVVVVVAVNERLASGFTVTDQTVCKGILCDRVTRDASTDPSAATTPQTLHPAADARPARFDRPAREALYDAAVAG